jgi:hypothetical protein
VSAHEAEAQGAEGEVLTDAGTRTVTKSEQVAVDADRAREIIQPVVQPPIDIKFVGVFAEDALQPVVTGDVDPDVLAF